MPQAFIVLGCTLLLVVVLCYLQSRYEKRCIKRNKADDALFKKLIREADAKPSRPGPIPVVPPPAQSVNRAFEHEKTLRLIDLEENRGSLFAEKNTDLEMALRHLGGPQSVLAVYQYVAKSSPAWAAVLEDSTDKRDRERVAHALIRLSRAGKIDRVGVGVYKALK